MLRGLLPLAGLAALFISGASRADLLSEEDLPKWRMAGPGSFEVKDGVATPHGGMGLWWFGEHELRNFTVELEFKWDTPQWNSGIFVRFPDPGNDPWEAVHKGYEIQLCGTELSPKHTGSVYSFQAPALLPELTRGEWNTCRITCAGPRIAVFLNDTLVNVYRCQPGRGDEKGFFGLQNHDDTSPVQFRNITLKEWEPFGSLLDAFTQDEVPRAQLVNYNAARWPAGQAPGAAPTDEDWYRLADHGPAFYQTFGAWEDGSYQPDAALKGVVLSYSVDPNRVALFNTETLSLVSATDEGTRLDNTPWSGAHGKQNKFLNDNSALFVNTSGPGWADASESFADSRPEAPHGNLSYAKYHGHFRHGHRTVLDYRVHGARILDTLREHPMGLLRQLEVGPSDTRLLARLAKVTEGTPAPHLAGKGAIVATRDGYYILSINPSDQPRTFSLLYRRDASRVGSIRSYVPDPAERIEGGPALYPETFTVEGNLASGDGPWLVDTIPLPPALNKSPYLSRVRISDFDFFSGGDRAAVCTWDGDVWLVDGLNEFKTITWKRFATGMFEPLGLRIVDEVVHLNARDAIWKLHDLNDDQECDHYEIFNNEVLITNNFHEFSFGLETDPEGNFLFTKAGPVKAGGRGYDPILRHHGTVLRLSRDGNRLDILATGLRAAGGIGVGPHGEITTGENEGTWQPSCKLNYFTPAQAPVFLGVEDLAGELAGQPLHPPLCYLPMSVDNSGGSQVWVPTHARVGLHPGELLHLSYGRSAIYRVLSQRMSDGNLQGGVVKIPVTLDSSAQRAAFHPDGSLYVLGMRGWQTNAATEAAFHRLRFAEDAVNPLPDALSVGQAGISIRFQTRLDKELANDPTSFTIEKWKYIRGPQYGSGEFSIDDPDEEMEKIALEKESRRHRKHDEVKVTEATLQTDGKTVILQCANLTEAEQMTITYDLESEDGEVLTGTIVNTVHELR